MGTLAVSSLIKEWGDKIFGPKTAKANFGQKK